MKILWDKGYNIFISFPRKPESRTQNGKRFWISSRSVKQTLEIFDGGGMGI